MPHPHLGTINKDDVIDAYLQDGQVILILRDGSVVRLPYSVASSLYWEVKIRNRRRAFGL